MGDKIEVVTRQEFKVYGKAFLLESEALQWEELNDMADKCDLKTDYFEIKKEEVVYLSKREYFLTLLEQIISVIGKANFDTVVRNK